jgi:hypothetical protein
MHKLFWLLIISLSFDCTNNEHHRSPVSETAHSSYAETKARIVSQKQQLSRKYFAAGDHEKQKLRKQITAFWITGLSEDLYGYWKNTPWSFNGTTQTPQDGSIACGYLVTTMLVDMDLKINRVKLAICPSSEMMKSLVPHQRIKNLSGLSYNEFADSLKGRAKGVYIIGLDYHTGFIIIDDNRQWFLHSNYINKQGVIKEPVQNSQALKMSKTRWMVSLTGDDSFITTWLKSDG